VQQITNLQCLKYLALAVCFAAKHCRILKFHCIEPAELTPQEKALQYHLFREDFRICNIFSLALKLLTIMCLIYQTKIFFCEFYLPQYLDAFCTAIILFFQRIIFHTILAVTRFNTIAYATRFDSGIMERNWILYV
jgi:hypothetical protein